MILIYRVIWVITGVVTAFTAGVFLRYLVLAEETPISVVLLIVGCSLAIQAFFNVPFKSSSVGGYQPIKRNDGEPLPPPKAE